jgi:IS5 family transposase
VVHTAVGAATNVSDITQAHALVHGDECEVFGDAGCQGVENREENQAAIVGDGRKCCF